ncbi:MAG: hypothetical protein AAF614_14090 [Chloroflexota bacterium]
MFESILIFLITVSLWLIFISALTLSAHNASWLRIQESANILSHTKRTYLEKLAQLLGFKFLVGPTKLPRLDYLQSLASLEKTKHASVRNKLTGWHKKCELQLFEFEYYKPAEHSRDNPVWRQRLVLLITNDTFALPLFHVRAKTWIDRGQKDGFVVSNSYVWGEDMKRLRAVFDWEVVSACETFSNLHIVGVHNQLVVTWRLPPTPSFRWLSCRQLTGQKLE